MYTERLAPRVERVERGRRRGASRRRGGSLRARACDGHRRRAVRRRRRRAAARQSASAGDPPASVRHGDLAAPVEASCRTSAERPRWCWPGRRRPRSCRRARGGFHGPARMRRRPPPRRRGRQRPAFNATLGSPAATARERARLHDLALNARQPGKRAHWRRSDRVQRCACGRRELREDLVARGRPRLAAARGDDRAWEPERRPFSADSRARSRSRRGRACPERRAAEPRAGLGNCATVANSSRVLAGPPPPPPAGSTYVEGSASSAPRARGARAAATGAVRAIRQQPRTQLDKAVLPTSCGRPTEKVLAASSESRASQHVAAEAEDRSW